MSSIVPHQPPLFPERICTKCGQSKLLDDFHVDKRTGRPFARCKDCHNAQTLARYHALHPKREKVAPSEKHCPRCKRVLPASAFETQPGKPHLLRSWCRECRKADKARYTRAHKAEIDAYNAAYRATHRAQMAEAARLSRSKKPEYYNGLSRTWKAKHPQERISHTHKRRAILRGMPGVVSAWDWECIKAQHDWRCVDCGRQEKTDGITLCRDHIIPLRPGFNIAANIAPRCRSCNSKKHRRLLKRREG